MTWTAFLVQLAGFLKALLVPLAYFFGKLAGKKEAVGEQNAENAELGQAYAEIATKGTTDEEIDQKLDSGTF